MMSDPTPQKRRSTAALQNASEISGRGTAATLWSAAVLRRFSRRIGRQSVLGLTSDEKSLRKNVAPARSRRLHRHLEMCQSAQLAKTI